MIEASVAEIIIKIALAAFLGGAVGLQRERADRPAGFRTHVLVAIGSRFLH